MATTWVLILVLAGGTNGYAITTAYFNSQYRCEAAAAEWNKGEVYLTRVTARCHQK